MLSKQNIDKLRYLWSDEHAVDWIEVFIKIVDKQGKVVPFKLTDEQRYVLENLADTNIILKSRQLGISSVIMAESIREVITRSNCTCALISHTTSSCNAVFAKLKQMYSSMPEWLKPKLIENNRQALTLENGSQIVCLTAGNKDLLRGSTVNGIAHCSEFAFWKDQDRQLKSLTQACSDTAKIVIESTANGYNKFSEMYMQAKHHENTYKSFFFGWINGYALFENQYKNAVEKFKNLNHGSAKITDFSDEELRLKALGASDRQLIWRRDKIGQNGEEAFKVEFPSTDEECFITTGTQIFDVDRIAKLLATAIFPKPLAYQKCLGLNKGMIRWIVNNSFRVFELPQNKTRYYMGVDVSEGIGQDSSTFLIFTKDGKNVAAFSNNKIKPYEFADVCYMVGTWYNTAQLIVEKASGGHSVIERLHINLHYRNMAKYKTYDEFNRMQWKIGFETTSKSKGIAVNDAVEWFDKGWVQINDKQTLEEMRTFVFESNGSMNAVSGAHDDMVSALWLTIQGIKSGLWYL